MVKKALTLLTSLLIALPLLMPFNIYADTIDSHIRGRNYTYEPITYEEVQVSTSNKYYNNIGVYHITFELDDEYIGYVLPNYTLEFDNYFYGSSSPHWGTLTKSFNRRVFVNGSSFTFDITINWNSLSINTANTKTEPFYYDSYTISSSDITKYADIDSLDQIINILQDLYNSNDEIEGLLSNELEQLELVVSNTSLANQYLDIISKFRQFRYPIESFTFINDFFSDNNKEYIDFYEIGDYTFPLFKTNDDFVYRFSSNQDYDIILGINKEVYSVATFNNIFTLSNATLKSVKFIHQTNYTYNGTRYRYYIVNLKITRNSSDSYLRLKSYNDTVIMPIYSEYSSNNNISTDFALQFGLNNKLLDNLNLIANGTNASQSAAQSSDSANSQLQTDSNTLFQQENGFKSDMQNAMQNVNNTFRLQDMGTKFVSSAQWVRTQYEQLTNNTPFASLITFSLITGLALILLGKVYK